MTSFNSIKYEDPSTLPFKLPAGVGEVDAAFMQAVLRHRGAIGEDVEVTSIEKSDVGMTAGYFSSIVRVKLTYSKECSAPPSMIVKSWPPFELLSKDAIKGMFIMDMKGYSEFTGDEWYPRPNVYLASYDESEDRWALVMEDAYNFADHAVHEKPLTLEQVKIMIPALVDFAVRFEGCNEESSPMFERTKHIPPWSAAAMTFEKVGYGGAALFDEFTGKPDAFDVDDKEKFGFPKLAPWKSWKEDLGGDFSQLFFKAYEKYWANSAASEGATCTVSHGDLRGDNLFFDKQDPTKWYAIDFQLCFQGPIASDLAYLMTSGSVLPEVYTENTEEVLKMFYDLFMTKTTKYKDLTYEKFRSEYITMTMVLYTYYVAMGAAIWQAGTMDHDGGLGACIKEGGVGSGAISYAHLPEAEKRKRYWWNSSINNFRVQIKQFGMMDMLAKMDQKDVDFQAAFNTKNPRGCPWPKGEDGKFIAVDQPTAIALSNGSLNEKKAAEIAGEDGTVTMDAFNKVVIPGWSLLAAVSQPSA